MRYFSVAATRVFKIEIADRNDHPPKFEHQEYEADIPENADLNSPVTEVHANDRDSGKFTAIVLGPLRGVEGGYCDEADRSEEANGVESSAGVEIPITVERFAGRLHRRVESDAVCIS